MLSHVFGIGATVNASGNRIAEATEDAILSLFTVGELLNMASMNQSTHQVLVINNSVSSAANTSPTSQPRPNDNTDPDLVGGQYRTLRMNQVMFDADQSVNADGVHKLSDFVARPEFLNILLRPAT